MADCVAFNEHMRSLTNSENETTLLPEGEKWEQMIERIHETGRIHSIKEETYWYFLQSGWTGGTFTAIARLWVVCDN